MCRGREQGRTEITDWLPWPGERVCVRCICVSVLRALRNIPDGNQNRGPITRLLRRVLHFDWSGEISQIRPANKRIPWPTGWRGRREKPMIKRISIFATSLNPPLSLLWSCRPLPLTFILSFSHFVPLPFVLCFLNILLGIISSFPAFYSFFPAFLISFICFIIFFALSLPSLFILRFLCHISCCFHLFLPYFLLPCFFVYPPLPS